MTLKEAVERFRLRHGFYPESVHVDTIYRNRDNIRYCNGKGVHISGPRLGRPPKEPEPAVIMQACQDALDRNCGEEKRRVRVKTD